VLVIDRTRNPFQSSSRSTFSAEGDPHPNDNQRRNEIEYHDEPSTETEALIADSQTSGEWNNHRSDTGPAMQPSRLQGEGTEWREV